MNSIETKEAELKELEAKSAELATQIEQKRKELEQEFDGPFEMPMDGELAWFYATTEVLSSSKWSDTSGFDAYALASGLVSKNKSDIERIVELERQWGQFRLKAIQIADGWVPDWSDFSQEKHYVFYSPSDYTFDTGNDFYMQHPMTVYFKTEAQAQRLANWANKYVRVK